MAYIYKITNEENDKFYIGKSVKHYKYRFNEHVRHAMNFGSNTATKSRSHLYAAMHEAFLLGKLDIFKISVVEECAKADLGAREQFWIDKLDATNPAVGYNLTKGGTGGDTYSFLTEEEKRQRNEKLKASLKNSARKGKICITKDYKNIYILPEELSAFENLGWTRGCYQPPRPSMRGRKQPKSQIEKRIATFSARSEEEKRITSEKHAKSTKAQMAKLSTEERRALAMAGVAARQAGHTKDDRQMWIHKGTQNAFVYETDLASYLADGYVVGIYVSDASREKRSNAHKDQENALKGKVWMYKDDTQIYIQKDQLEHYLSDGWQRGRLALRKPKKKK